jgi:cytochrome c oxidase subunit 1
MSAETHEGVHRHPAPTGFIRKYIFSVDHKVIGIQYIMLALAAVAVGMTMSLLMRLNLSWPGTSWPILETLFPTGAPGRRDDAGILFVPGHDARHHHGVLCPHYRAAGRFR